MSKKSKSQRSSEPTVVALRTVEQYATPQRLASEHIFTGRVFRLRIDQMRFPDGSEHRIDVIEHPGSVGIVATTEAGAIVLIRQYRPAIDLALWEIPAGKLDGPEDPLVAAARELREESGFRAEHVELMHFVRATGLTPGAHDPDEDERLDAAVFTLARGEIADVKTAYALAMLGV